MRDFQEFLSGDVVVKSDSYDEQLLFLKLCESNNIRWNNWRGDGDPATYYTPSCETEGIRYDPKNGYILKGALLSYARDGRTIVSAKEFLFKDFSEFKEGKVAVLTSGDTDNSFLKLCEEEGLSWSDGSPATSVHVGDSWAVRHTNGGIRRSIKDYYTETLGVPVVSYIEFCYDSLNAKPVEVETVIEPELRVEIYRKGRKVICKEYLGITAINKGTASCHPDDTFDFKFGSDLAYGRMRGREVKAEKPEVSTGTISVSTKVVKQDNYSVGDVVMMGDPKSCYHSIANSFMGKTQVISEVLRPNRYGIEGSNYTWSDEDISGKIVHVEAKPKFVKKDYYDVGDVVRIKKKWKSGMQNPEGGMDEYLGTDVTISEVHKTIHSYEIKEDGGRWEWFHDDIKGVIQ